MRSRVMQQSGPNLSRPSNMPMLRRSASNGNNNSNNNNNNNNNNVAMQYSKSDPSSTSNHVLTPFDYPLSNPTVSSKSGVHYDAHSYYSKYIKQENTVHSAPLYS